MTLQPERPYSKYSGFQTWGAIHFQNQLHSTVSKRAAGRLIVFSIRPGVADMLVCSDFKSEIRVDC